MHFRQALLRAVLAAVAVMLVFAGPSFGVRGASSSTHGSLRDFSKTTAPNRPTAAQRAAVRALHAKATWNTYGTAATLMRPGGYLTKQAAGATAEVAARSWLAKHKVIFRLGSVRDLRLVADSKLTGGRAHAVTFQQSFGGLKVVNGAGLVTVSLVPGKLHRWKVGFVSSTSVGTLHSTGNATLSPAQAFVHAAGSLGLKTSLMNVRAQKVARGWTNLRVGGFRDLQRVRLGSYGLGRAAVPAYEAFVLHRGARTLAFRTVVNARTGAILARTNLTDNFATTRIKHANAVQTIPFNGELASTDGACGVRHGPYTVGPGVRALSGFAAATINTNDVVFKLFFGASTTPLITADTLFSPEQFRYAPAGGVPPGDYFVQVCDFPDGAAWASPRTYDGTVTIDDSPAPPAYWARWKAFPATPPLSTTDQYPWGNPSTDTRKTWCWRSAPGCDIVVGNLASRVPWDYDARTNTTTFTTSGNNNRDATSWVNDSAPSPPQHTPVSTGPDYSFPWTNDWNSRQCQRAATETPRTGSADRAARHRLRRPRRGDEPLRDAQPDARLLVLPCLHGAELERPVRQLREHR